MCAFKRSGKIGIPIAAALSLVAACSDGESGKNGADADTAVSGLESADDAPGYSGKAPLDAARLSAEAMACDSALGEQAYNKCTMCHSMEPNVHLMGPSLHGLFQRKAGGANGYQYSQALAEAGFEWSAAAFDAFMENPMGRVPGTAMPFAGIQDPDERKALACWIKTRSEGR